MAHPGTALENSKPTDNAKVSIKAAGGRAEAEILVPSTPTSNLLRLITYVLAAVGAATAPQMTFSALPEGPPPWAVGAVALGQEVILIALILAATTRRST